MKIGVLSESPADQAAIRILVNRILNIEVAPTDFPLRARQGFPHLRKLIRPALLHTYYNTDAAGLVVLADSNGSPLHESGRPAPCSRECRYCYISGELNRAAESVRPTDFRQKNPLRFAVAIAAPAIEAWYLCGSDAVASEEAWIAKLRAGAKAAAYIRDLKTRLYGTAYPKSAATMGIAVQRSQRLAERLGELERCFPAGLGAFAAQLRSWRQS